MRVSYTDPFGAAESVTSAATSAVENVNDEPTGSVVISGSAEQGETLTADATAISDADGLGTFAYQWQRDGSAIAGANDESYSLGQGDVGSNISVRVADPIRSLLNIAHRNGVRLSRLVDNILLVQKIDINALILESKPVDLGHLLEESFEENKMFASTRGVRLALGNIMPAVIIGDAFAIRQIIDNLISNAIKFSNENGVVEGRLIALNGQVRLSIKNSGRGIPEGMESQVFGRFEQVGNSGQSSTQGSGLGLHISKKLAKQMSGDIFYESQLGVGTTFHVEFELVDQQAIS